MREDLALLLRDYISISQMRKHSNCPRSYYYRYIEGLSEAPTPIMAKGGLIERFVWDIHERGAKGPRLDIFEDKIEVLSPDEIDTCFYMADYYYQNFASWKWDNDIQYQVHADVDIEMDGKIYKLKGVLDILTDKGIYEIKTTSKLMSEIPILNRFQPLLYSLAYPDRELYLHYIRNHVSKSGEDFKEIHLVFSDAERNLFFDMIKDFRTAIESGVFFRNTNSFYCNSKSCDFFGICRGER